jgi:hypothetical protein
MALFDAFPPKQRGSSGRGSAAVAFAPGPVFRTSARVADIPYDDELTLIHKNDDTLVIAEERPPPLPYSWQVCSTNTFTCSDSSITPQGMQEQVKNIIRKSPADVSACSEWEFNAVFYPEEQRTAFKVSIFENASDPKNSCLVEMQLQEGDRVAFQGLVSHVRSKAKLKYAFAEQWGFDDEGEEEFDDKCDDSYTHTSFAPLPLPSSLLASLKPATKDSFLPDDSKNPLVDILLENSCSPFADVRRTAWQEMAHSTNETAFAKSLLGARADGKDCIALAGAELKTPATCSLTIDTQRCVLKTLLNIAKLKNSEACCKICVLKPHILQLASEGTRNPTETRAIGVQLMQSLVGYRKADDADFVRELQARCVGTCRVSELARNAVSSLGSLEIC